jgi:hypothetical protein
LAIEGAEPVEEDADGDVKMENGSKSGTEAVKRRRLDTAYTGLGDREDEDDDEVHISSPPSLGLNFLFCQFFGQHFDRCARSKSFTKS